MLWGSQGPGLIATMQQIMQKPRTPEEVALRQGCTAFELTDLQASALQACRILVQQLGMQAGDLRSFGQPVNQMLQVRCRTLSVAMSALQSQLPKCYSLPFTRLQTGMQLFEEVQLGLT